MNKLILTLSFGILASSAFANVFEKNVKTAQTAYQDAKQAGTVKAKIKGAKKSAGIEYQQHDLGDDVKKMQDQQMLRTQTLTPESVEASVKTANENDLH